MGCDNLSAITVPEGVVRICERAFYRCRSLAKVDLPDTLLRIDCDAFYGCDALGTLTIPPSVTEIDDDALPMFARMTIVGASGSAAERFASRAAIRFEEYGGKAL